MCKRVYIYGFLFVILMLSPLTGFSTQQDGLTEEEWLQRRSHTLPGAPSYHSPPQITPRLKGR